MTTAILFLVIIAFLVITRIYGEENHRLPPVSTPKGRQARILGVAVLLIGIVALIFNVADEGSGSGRVVAIEEVGLGIAIAVVLALMRINRKPK